MILILDMHFLMHRTLRLPDYFNMNYNGTPTGGIYGVLLAIHSTLESMYKPRLKLAVFDGHKSERRLKLHPEYKGNRKPKTEQEKLYDQEYFSSFNFQKSALMHKALPALGICPIQFANKEADDVIYQLCEMYKTEDEIFVISEDNDLLQLIIKFPNVVVYQPIKKLRVDAKNLETLSGVPQELFLLRKAIAGDKGDNIKGIPGIGEVTAQKIVDKLDKTDPINSLYKFALDNKDDKSRLAKLYEHWKVVAKNLELIDISREEFLPSDIEALKKSLDSYESKVYYESFHAVCAEFGFNSIINKFDQWMNIF